jgi:NAD+ synthetase
VVVASVNQLGANDELIFDGHRYVFGPDGEIAATGSLFDGEMLVVDVAAKDVGQRDGVSPHGGSSPQSHRDTEKGRDQQHGRARPTPPSSPTHRLTVSPSQSPSSHPTPGVSITAPDPAHLHAALVLGIRDYLHKTGFKKAILGLSGGIDSALTAALAVAAIGAENVTGYALPGPYSSEHSITDAHAVADALGMRCDVVPIAAPMHGFRDAIDQQFAAMGTTKLGEQLPDVTEENLQSRIRGTLLMAISNRTGAIVLTTGNKSEMAVGYCTLYGDMNGGLAVLSDVTKHWVYALSRFVNENFATLAGLTHCTRPPIPESTLTKPPSAELRPNQTDQDSLPPYDLLDDILARSIERHQSPATIARETGHDPALVRKITRMIDLAEYKRRQSAMGLKVTTVAFGTGRRMPIAQRS